MFVGDDKDDVNDLAIKVSQCGSSNGMELANTFYFSHNSSQLPNLDFMTQFRAEPTFSEPCITLIYET